MNCQPLTLNRQSGDRNVWQFDYPACLLYLYCLKGSVLMGTKRREKNKWIVNSSLWIDKLGIWICDKLLVLLVYPVLILTSNNHQPHWLKDWKPKRGKCKQIIKSVPLNRQMECLTTWWTNSVCLWSEILFLLMWGSVDILCPIEEKIVFFFTYILTFHGQLLWA